MAHVNKQMARIEQTKMNSLNLTENLAEIEFIMSDKTGTLTKNELTLVAACCDSQSSFLLGKITRDENGLQVKQEGSLMDYLQDKIDFLTCLLICHDCTILEVPISENKTKRMLSGPSLDEQCLLQSVHSMKGVGEFKQRTAWSLTIQIGKDDLREYDLLATNEFSSERKLMSVLVRDKRDQKIYVFAKGAESQIMQRLTEQSVASELKSQIEQEVHNFAEKGLRTLLFAMREVSPEEFSQMNLKASPEEVADACERELTVIACTGVEDELQDNVAECIQDFRDAGIKFWMLTGDMGATAKEIGYNCGVMSRDQNETSLFKIESLDRNEIAEQIIQLKQDILKEQANGRKITLMIAGQSFARALSLDKDQVLLFQKEVLLKADSVIIFRSSPKQKADAVELVKNVLNGKKTTLAIGDGFNDVHMI